MSLSSSVLVQFRAQRHCQLNTCKVEDSRTVVSQINMREVWCISWLWGSNAPYISHYRIETRTPRSVCQLARSPLTLGPAVVQLFRKNNTRINNGSGSVTIHFSSFSCVSTSHNHKIQFKNLPQIVACRRCRPCLAVGNVGWTDYHYYYNKEF